MADAEIRKEAAGEKAPLLQVDHLKTHFDVTKGLFSPKQIVKAVDGSMKIFVDGGLRSGTDVFKALALGADAVIIARPYVTAVYGGGAEGVSAYTEKLGAELADTMSMCGASSLKEITRDMVR